MSFSKRFIKTAFNAIGLDIVRLNKIPLGTLLGLKHLSISTIIDVGANEGQFARKISKVYPNSHMFCFEPLSKPFEKLKKWGDQQNGKVIVINAALGDTEGKVKMMLHLDHTPSSSLLKTTPVCEMLYPFTQNTAFIHVNVTTLDKVMANFSVSLIPDILIKLDVQGFEDRVIKGGTETFRKAKACILEVNLDELYENQATFKDIVLMLYDLGFLYAGNLEQVYSDDGHVICIDVLFIK